MANEGSKNGFWKGGRTIASNGYVLIRVGKDHHLADVRGYAYEHRLVMENKLGRQLIKGEIVHHIDENKQNNHPDNLELKSSIKEHLENHRKRKDLKPLDEGNYIVSCACGCGNTFMKYDDDNRPRKFVHGHNNPRNETGRFI
jgi:hypothetical protein